MSQTDGRRAIARPRFALKMHFVVRSYSHDFFTTGEPEHRPTSFWKYPAQPETVQDIGPRLLLNTNRKSHKRFRLVPKSTTLDDLEFNNDELCNVYG